ncbi:uncharacterized protein LOC117106514, partial [Anneissia japonica]|uniref:uncharacterized protein LOC117106514 n=1 Tax=Anneissia japonica TaxID=1529436 RepID=UPI001425BA32
HDELMVEKPYTPTLKKKKTSAENNSTSSPRVDVSAFMGPLPKNKSIFKGMNFLITHGDVVKRSANSSSDGSTSEDESQMRFNRDYAYKQIVVGGGNVLKSYDSSQ